jgi:uncharacterized protein YkwD
MGLGVSVMLVAAWPRTNDSGARPQNSHVRLVLSSRGATSVRALSTSSLYAKGDPWKGYLATEDVCPGGERTDLSLVRQEQTLICLVNWARKQRGLAPLQRLTLLNTTSSMKARDIVRCESFAHNPCGGDWAVHVRAAGYSGGVGENLYLASGPWSAPRVAVDGWLNSPEHRANLFDPQWRRQGLAAVEIAAFLGHRSITIWVNEFGTR